MEYAFLRRGKSKVLLLDFSSALSDYNKAIELSPYYVDSYYERGIVHALLKDNIKACLDWYKAKELGEEHADKYINTYCK